MQDEGELYQAVLNEWENQEQSYIRYLVLLSILYQYLLILSFSSCDVNSKFNCHQSIAFNNAAGGHKKYCWLSLVKTMKIKLKS